MNFIKWLLGAIILILPVPIWNSWLLDYIDEHGKLLPMLTAPIFALASTIVFMGTKEMKKPIQINGYVNPFILWFIGCLIISLSFAALSNT